MQGSVSTISGTERKFGNKINKKACYSYKDTRNNSYKVDLLLLWTFEISEIIHTGIQMTSVFWKCSGAFGPDNAIHSGKNTFFFY